MSGWFETVSSRRVHEGWSDVRIDVVRMPDGTEAEREVVEHRDAVAIVPLLADGTVVLLRQYRHAIGEHLLEVPAGVLDVPGESHEQAAQRELAEEVGLHAGRLDHLSTIHNSAGWSTERTHLYLARDLTDAPAPDGFVAVAEEADMEVVRLPLDAVVAAIVAGEVSDAKTVAGVLLAAARQRDEPTP